MKSSAAANDADDEARFLKASDSEIDRQTTAVLAHEQLVGALATACPDAETLASDLDALAPLRLVDAGVSPEHSIQLYKAIYKYAKGCDEAFHGVVSRVFAGVDQDSRDESLHAVWRVAGATWEASAGAAFPSQIGRLRAVEPELDEMTSAVNRLSAELAEATALLESARAESASRREEMERLSPYVGRAEDAARRAEAGEADRDAWREKCEFLETELEQTKETLGAEGAIRAEIKSESDRIERELRAELKYVAEHSAKKYAAAEANWARERVKLVDDVAVAESTEHAAREAEKDAKAITGTLKADIAFLREKRSGAEKERVAAIARAAQAEELEARATEQRDVARKDFAEKKAEAESLAASLKDMTEKHESAVGRLFYTTTRLEQQKRKVEELETRGDNMQLSVAIERAYDQENRADEAERELAATKKELKELKALMKEFEAKFAEEKRRADDAEAKVEGLEATVAHLTTENDRLTAEVVALTEQLDVLKAKIAELETRIEELETEVATLKEEVKFQKKRADALSKQVKKMKKEIIKTDEAHDRGASRLVDGDKNVTRMDAAKLRAAAVEEADAAGDSAAPKSTKIAGAAATARGVDDAFGAQDAKWDAVIQNVATFAASVDDKLDGAATAFAEWSDASTSIARVAIDKANGAVAELKATLAALRTTKAELERTKAELEKTLRELADAKEDLEKTKAELKKKTNELEDAKTTIYTLEQRADELEEGKAAAEKKAADERAGRMKAQFVGASMRAMKDKHRDDAEKNADEAARLSADVAALEESAERDKESRASAHAAHATTKMRLGLLKAGIMGAGGGGPGGGGGGDAPQGPQSFVSKARIMEGTPESMVPYMSNLADEYVDASVALKEGASSQ